MNAEFDPPMTEHEAEAIVDMFWVKHGFLLRQKKRYNSRDNRDVVAAAIRSLRLLGVPSGELLNRRKK